MGTPDEWIEMSSWIEVVWAARDASASALNAARRARFDAVKCAIGERDLPPSITHNNSNVTRLKAR